MAYKPDIPQSSDVLSSQSQADFLENFKQIKIVIDINHVTFDATNDGQGKHKFITLPVTATNPAILDDECSLFTKTVTVYDTPTHTINRSELFLQKKTAGVPVEITGGGNVTDNAAATQPLMESGWSRLPSGLLMKWCGGVFFPGPNNTVGIVFNADVTGPAFTNILTAYGSIRLPGAAENKFVYVSSFELATQTIHFNCMPRYGNPADISNFYIDCLVLGI